MKPIIRLSQITLYTLFFSQFASAQYDSSAWIKNPEISFSGYLDNYFAYDFNKPNTTYRQTFLYNHNRHNAFSLNLGYIKVSAKHQKYRANIALQAGTYVNDNYATEDETLKHVFESNAGISLNKKNNLWLDAGIFGSPIGFESAISKDNWTLTRSLLAENSPYYLSGAKLTYNPNKNWEMAGIICNGWQRIHKLPGYAMPGFCTQIKYSNTNKLTLNWSTFIGSAYPDSIRRMRYFNNFYMQSQLTKKIGLIAGFDIGIQQIKKGSREYNTWFSPVLIARFFVSDKFFTALRAEYYADKSGIIIPTNTYNGFKTSGISLNLDYLPSKNIACRVEGRWLKSKDNIFTKHNHFVNSNFALVSSIAVSF